MIIRLAPMLSRPDRKRHHAPEIFGSSITSYASTFTQPGAGMPKVILAVGKRIPVQRQPPGDMPCDD